MRHGSLERGPFGSTARRQKIKFVSNAGHRPVVIGCSVRFADNQNLRDRPFAAAVREAKADAQTAGSISLT
jgi:urease beta subunit